MHVARRPLARALLLTGAVLAAITLAFAQQRARIEVQHYDIDAELIPQSSRLEARAKVQFTAVDDIATAVFELHNGLRVTKVTDAAGKTLASERVSQDSTVRVALPEGLAKGQSTTLTFEYEGVLRSMDDSPVEGLKLAYIGDDTAYLLSAGRWFPVANYGTDPFTSTISMTAPLNWKVIGSGSVMKGRVVEPAPAADTKKEEEEAPQLARGRRAKPKKPAAQKKPESTPPPVRTTPAGKTTLTFQWDRPSFPGTILAGQYLEHTSNAGGMNIKVFFKPLKQKFMAEYADLAAKEMMFFTTLYGPPISTQVNIVELPDDTVPALAAPEIAGIASRAIQEKAEYRLLANTLSRQWWGVAVAPASLNDFWITEGLARYSEARYVEHAAGPQGFEEASKDMAVGALAYDTIPMNSLDRMPVFSPEFQSLATDKGAMIFNMLRWTLGDAVYDRTLREFYAAHKGKRADRAALQAVVEKNNGGQNMAWFFTQWLDSSGAPEFKNKYTVYRTKNGFRVVGEISQDLDLFRMPVELRIDTDGKSEMKRIEVVGTNSPYAVETFGKPRRISIDPDARVLKNSPELRVRVSILRGQQLVQQGDLAEALREYQKALEVNRDSSLAHYRIGEVFFLQRNYQAAANAYRQAADGDREPRWTEVWSYIQLGKIFDITGQRERAVNEYRKALNTNDNTQGALEEARKCLAAPCQRDGTQSAQSD